MCHRRLLVVAALLALGMTLSGCESFDPTDWFNQKKPLPGDRKPVFQGGVPGVPQGVPPELVQGYQPPAEPPVVEAPAEKPKPRAKPVPKPASAPPARPAAARPAPGTNAGQPAPSQVQSPFPDPPRPGTISR